MNRSLRLTTGVTAAVAVIALLASGKMNDYVSYVEQWASVARGEVPWRLESDIPVWNSYGPLFLAFAPLSLIHPLLPKLVFGAAWLAGFFALAGVGGLATRQERRWLLGGYLLAPFFWVDVVMYGHFDTLVAVLVALAVWSLRRGREVMAAAAVAAGVLLKFMPLALLPVLVRVDGRCRWRFAVWVGALLAAGFLIPYSIWGEATFYPFVNSAHRGPKLLSIFNYLDDARYSVLNLWGSPTPQASRLSVPLMVAAVLAASAFHWLKRLDLWVGTLIATMAMVTFYKVGHLQFFALPVVLILAWLVDTEFRPLADPALARALKGFLWWLSCVSLLYTWTGAFNAKPWPIVRSLIGIPAFAVDLWVTAVLIRYASGQAPAPSVTLAGRPQDGGVAHGT
jgi:hypothetical protein